MPALKLSGNPGAPLTNLIPYGISRKLSAGWRTVGGRNSLREIKSSPNADYVMRRKLQFCRKCGGPPPPTGARSPRGTGRCDKAVPGAGDATGSRDRILGRQSDSRRRHFATRLAISVKFDRRLVKKLCSCGFLVSSFPYSMLHPFDETDTGGVATHE